MHSENLDFFLPRKRTPKISINCVAAASKLHSLYRKSIEKTVRTTTALYLRVVMVVCAAFCNGLGEELTRSSIAAATYRINFFLSTSVSIFHEEESCESLCCNVFSLRW